MRCQLADRKSDPVALTSLFEYFYNNLRGMNSNSSLLPVKLSLIGYDGCIEVMWRIYTI